MFHKVCNLHNSMVLQEHTKLSLMSEMGWHSEFDGVGPSVVVSYDKLVMHLSGVYFKILFTVTDAPILLSWVRSRLDVIEGD